MMTRIISFLVGYVVGAVIGVLWSEVKHAVRELLRIGESNNANR